VLMVRRLYYMVNANPNTFGLYGRDVSDCIVCYYLIFTNFILFLVRGMKCSVFWKSNHFSGPLTPAPEGV